MFKLMDINHDGVLDEDEFRTYMLKVHPTLAHYMASYGIMQYTTWPHMVSCNTPHGPH